MRIAICPLLETYQASAQMPRHSCLACLCRLTSAVLQAAAQLYEASGDHNAATALYIRAQSFEEASRVIADSGSRQHQLSLARAREGKSLLHSASVVVISPSPASWPLVALEVQVTTAHQGAKICGVADSGHRQHQISLARAREDKYLLQSTSGSHIKSMSRYPPPWPLAAKNMHEATAHVRVSLLRLAAGDERVTQSIDLAAGGTSMSRAAASSAAVQL